MDTTTFDTVLGKLNFDDKGDVTLPGYVVYEWKDGKYDYMQHVVLSHLIARFGRCRNPGGNAGVFVCLLGLAVAV